MKLSHLTDKTLLADTFYWATKEREALTNVLWHLKEIDERKLFSDLKCSSLYDYCLKHLKYSEGQASRRVAACRLLRQLPQISKEIESGEIKLTQLNQAKSFFEEEQIKEPEKKLKVLEKLKGKTTRETDKILWELKKDPEPRKVNILLREETVDTLRTLRAIKAHTCPDYDALLMKMAVDVRKIWGPSVLRNRKEGVGDSRYVQVGVKARIWERDDAKCSLCGSTYGLEIDHIEPFALGGKTVESNLRILCRNCNQRKSILDFGRRTSAFK